MSETAGVYAYVSVPKKTNNAGRPTGKKPYVVLIPLKFIKTFTKDAKNVRVTAIALTDTNKPIGLYVTASSIKGGENVEGDDDARGFIHDLTFEHPGNEIEVQEFKEAAVNEPMIALVGDCNDVDFDVYGTPEAPLNMSKADGEDSKDKKNSSFELKSAYRTAPVGKIAKTLIPVTDSADVNTSLGLTATTPSTGA